jgi:D-alanine transaminase
MIEYAYYNGVFTPYGAAVIPLSDRSIFFSDAVYDVMVGRGKKVYQKDEHLDRLYMSAKMIGMEDLPDRDELCDAADELIAMFGDRDFILYVQLSTNSERRSHARETNGVNVLMTVSGCEIPRELSGIKAITLPDIRHRLCDVKTTSLLPSVLSVEEAKRRGADIAIFHRGDTVTECSYANVAILKDGVLITHPLDRDILPGITQQNLEAAADALGIVRETRTFNLEELYRADAVMISSTTKLVKVCTEIDGRELVMSDNGMVERLFDALKEDLNTKTG